MRFQVFERMSIVCNLKPRKVDAVHLEIEERVVGVSDAFFLQTEIYICSKQRYTVYVPWKQIIEMNT